MHSCDVRQRELRDQPSREGDVFGQWCTQLDNLRLNARAGSDSANQMIRKLYRLSIGIGIGITFTAACPVTLAQAATPPANTASASEDANLRQQFSAGFSKGCLAGQTPGITNQAGFCACMARTYTTRYSGKNLAAISELAARAGAVGPQLVDLMMVPERQACAQSGSPAAR